jgi:hypothetical protein
MYFARKADSPGPGSAHICEERSQAYSVYVGIPARLRMASPISNSLVKLSAIHSKGVDEINYEVVIPESSAISSANNSGGSSLCGAWNKFSTGLMSPVICTCFHFLFDKDGAISRIAFNAINAIITVAAEEAGAVRYSIAGQDNHRDSDGWMKRIESSVCTMARRAGLHSRDQTARS